MVFNRILFILLLQILIIPNPLKVPIPPGGPCLMELTEHETYCCVAVVLSMAVSLLSPLQGRQPVLKPMSYICKCQKASRPGTSAYCETEDNMERTGCVIK